MKTTWQNIQSSIDHSDLRALLSDKDRQAVRRSTDSFFKLNRRHDRDLGVAAGALEPVFSLLSLPIETGASPDVMQALGLDPALLNDDVALLSTQAASFWAAALKDPADAKVLNEFWSRIEELIARSCALAQKCGYAREILKCSLEAVSITIRAAGMYDDPALDHFLDLLYADIDESENAVSADDLQECQSIISASHILAMDVLEAAPAHGYTDAYVKVYADSGWSNQSTVAEADLSLHDLDGYLGALEAYGDAHPDDRWAGNATDDDWPDPAADGRVLAFADSVHHYVLEDYKESGRTASGTVRFLLNGMFPEKSQLTRYRALCKQHQF